jgi:hypothetical protein
MRRLAAAWDRFWFAPLDPLPAALFRIATGGLITLAYLASATNWDRFYAADGMLSLHDPAVAPVPQGWWSLFYWTEGVLPVRVYWGLGLAAALAFTVGWRTRLASIALFLVQASLVHRNPMVVNGEDLVFRMLLFYACFATLDAALALDARRGSHAGDRRPPRWPIRLMQINLALVYLISQPYKLVSDPAWLDGNAMYWVMVNRTWSRFPWPELYYHWWVAALSTWGSLAVELALPVGVWIAPVRRWVVLAAGALHVWIAITLQNVTFFSLAMTCSFLVFLTDEDLRRFARDGARLRALLTPDSAARLPAPDARAG